MKDLVLKAHIFSALWFEVDKPRNQGVELWKSMHLTHSINNVNLQ